MIAPRSTTHVADTLALLTMVYKGRPVIAAILTALANRTQAAENALWAVADALTIGGYMPTDTRGDLATVTPGLVIDLAGAPYGLVLYSAGGGITHDGLPAALTPGDPTFNPTIGVTVVDDSVTWTWVRRAPSGVWLDLLGEIVGEPRLNRLDPEYYLAVKVKLRVNRSQGQTQDILDVFTILGGSWAYYEDPLYNGDTFRIDVYSCPYPATYKRIVDKVRAAGIRAEFGWSSAPRASSSVWGESVWGNSVGPAGHMWNSVEVTT